MEQPANKKIIITQYKWAGAWGPFKIKSQCDECNMVTHRLRQLVENEFAGQDVVFELKPWLGNARYCLARGAWHPPIIMVNGKKFYQFSHGQPMFEAEQLTAHIKSLLSESEGA